MKTQTLVWIIVVCGLTACAAEPAVDGPVGSLSWEDGEEQRFERAAIAREGDDVVLFGAESGAELARAPAWPGRLLDLDFDPWRSRVLALSGRGFSARVAEHAVESDALAGPAPLGWAGAARAALPLRDGVVAFGERWRWLHPGGAELDATAAPSPLSVWQIGDDELGALVRDGRGLGWVTVRAAGKRIEPPTVIRRMRGERARMAPLPRGRRAQAAELSSGAVLARVERGVLEVFHVLPHDERRLARLEVGTAELASLAVEPGAAGLRLWLSLDASPASLWVVTLRLGSLAVEPDRVAPLPGSPLASLVGDRSLALHAPGRALVATTEGISAAYLVDDALVVSEPLRGGRLRAPISVLPLGY